MFVTCPLDGSRNSNLIGVTGGVVRLLGGRRRDLVSNGGRNGSRTGSYVLTSGVRRGLRFRRLLGVTSSGGLVPVRLLGVDEGLEARLGFGGVAFDDEALVEHDFTIGGIVAAAKMA